MRLALVLLFVLAGDSALADPAIADKRYKQGRVFYDLGKFVEAIAEFEAAYQADPNPKYLLGLAQSHRLIVVPEGRLVHVDKALFFYRRFVELASDNEDLREFAAGAAEYITALETERTALVAVKPPRTKRVRVAFDVGTSILYLDKDRRAPQLMGRLLGAYTKHFGKTTLDIGGSWHITTLPYETPVEGAVSSFYTQLNFVVSATRPIWRSFWTRLGGGIGFAAFNNLKQDNPITVVPSSDVRMVCARLDLMFGYAQSPLVDFVIGTGFSFSPGAKEAMPDKITTIEGLYIGIHLKVW